MANNQKLELTWIGKGNKPKLEPRIMIEDPDKSYGDRNAENMLIFGDNLLALKALEQAFSGRIKNIFIDPPYNTGSAFTHYDDGLEHSLWLSMMRNRLEILRRLLTYDGSIWITIDDAEGHYLKVMCDEIFGRINFIGTVTWQKTTSIHNNAVYFSSSTDMLLAFAKDISQFKMGRLARSERNQSDYSNPDNDLRGPWASSPLHVSLTSGQRGKQFAATGRSSGLFAITSPHGDSIYPPKGRCWAYSEESIKNFEQDGLIWWGKDGKNQPRLKRFLKENKEGVVPTTLWLSAIAGHNQEAKIENAKLLPELSELFSTPKPERLLQTVIQLSTNPGDWVLDSFAGSGTTGAVAHKMGRKWVMVELGEHCHTHIIPRLKKVCDGTDQVGVSKAANWCGGGGFRYYYMAPSLLKKDRYDQWVINEEYNAPMLAAAMAKHENFRYSPDEFCYWKQGRSSEKDFIFTTTIYLTPEHLDIIHEEMQLGENLLICCKSHFEGADDKYSNIDVKKIPSMLLGRCEFGCDDYSLNIVDMPRNPNEPEFVPSGPPVVEVKKNKKKSKAEISGQLNIFAGTED